MASNLHIQKDPSVIDRTQTERIPLEELLEYSVPTPKSLPIIVRGRGAEIEDEEGNKYLDFEGGPGVASVGHCHPAVVSAIQAQAEKLLQSPGKYQSRL